MEFQFPFSLIAFFLFLFFLYQVIRGYRSSKTHQKLPPGPWKLPLIGSLHHLAGGSTPHASLRDLAKKYGPLMHLRLGEVPAIVISSAEIAKEAMKTQDVIFASRPQYLTTDIFFYGNVDIAFCPYGDYWRQMRKICITELLGNKNVKSFRSIREDEISRLIASIRSASSSGQDNIVINVSQKVSSFVTSVLCRAAFGNTFKYQEQLAQLLKEMLTFLGGFYVADLFPSIKFLHTFSGTKRKLLKLHKKIDLMLENIIKDHGVNPVHNNGESDKEDLIEVLLGLQKDGGLKFPITHDNIKAIIWDVFSGAVDTSENIIEWAMSEMMKNPLVLEKAQAEVRQVFRGKNIIYENDLKELKYLKLIIKETLRLHTPGPFLVPRENTEATKIDGYDIPAKTQVLINYWAIARNPEYWHNAEKFEPERFDGSHVDFTGNNFEYIPFGAGRRICPGMSFGLATIELPLAQLLYHFNWKLPNGIRPQELDMSENHGITATRKNHLCLIATPYDP